MNDSLMQNALRAHQAGDLPEAARLCQDVLRTDPKHFQALYLLGFLHSRIGQYAEAERIIGEAIRVNPRASDALYNRGVMLQNLDRQEEALTCFDQALALKPDFLDAEINRGITLLALKRFALALESYDRAAKIGPNDAEVWNNRANALLELQRPEEALASLEKALALNPNLVSAFSNRGVALHRLRRHAEALKWFDSALAADPKNAAAVNNRGTVLMVLRRHADALMDFDRALAVQPDDIAALVNRGIVLMALKRSEEALTCYERVLKLQPRNADAYYNRASAFLLLKRFEDAARDCATLVKIDPNYNYALGFRNHFRLQCCDWSALAEERALITEGIRAGKRVIPPFANIPLGTTPADELACARICVNDLWPTSSQPLWRGERYRHAKIRVAYLSGDFRDTPMATLMAGIFEGHNKDRFETSAISILRDEGSNMQLRLMRAFGKFVDVQGKSDADVANLLRQMEIDIAVDLSGYTEPCRPGILAFRPAPIQVNYLGYPGTTGADRIDYILADRTVIPEDEKRHYSEQVVYLPGCYLPNDSKRRIAGTTLTHTEAGLPEHGFVFCSFNNSYKFSPEMFEIWMRLLRQVRNAVLWLPQSNDAAMRNLKREAESRGIAAGRLVFAPFLANPEDHLARLKLADLFLDTLPYNAHSSACDAMWAGLPLLTCRGSTFAGRAAASLLQTMELPELIAETPDAYESTALRLARDPEALAALRAKLARNRETSSLFDTARFTRNLEAAYVKMWERHIRNEPPASFAVESGASLL